MVDIDQSPETHCLRRRLSVVAEMWKSERKVGKPRLVSEESALHSGRIGRVTRRVAIGG